MGFIFHFKSVFLREHGFSQCFHHVLCVHVYRYLVEPVVYVPMYMHCSTFVVNPYCSTYNKLILTFFGVKSIHNWLLSLDKIVMLLSYL